MVIFNSPLCSWLLLSEKVVINTAETVTYSITPRISKGEKSWKWVGGWMPQEGNRGPHSERADWSWGPLCLWEAKAVGAAGLGQGQGRWPWFVPLYLIRSPNTSRIDSWATDKSKPWTEAGVTQTPSSPPSELRHDWEVTSRSTAVDGGVWGSGFFPFDCAESGCFGDLGPGVPIC